MKLPFPGGLCSLHPTPPKEQDRAHVLGQVNLTLEREMVMWALTMVVDGVPGVRIVARSPEALH
jgi:hypothetical protein